MILPRFVLIACLKVSEEFYFPKGLDVQISPKMATRWVRSEENYIEIHHIRKVDLVRVVIQPA